MAIRKFVAPTTREAMMQVRRELGDDAVIIANRSAGNRIEILAAAPDAVDALVERSETRAATPLRGRAPAQAQATGRDPGQPKIEAFQDFVRRQMQTEVETAPPQRGARDVPARANAQPVNRLANSSGVAMYHDVAEFEAEEVATPQPQQAEVAPMRAAVRPQATTLPHSHRAQQIETSAQATDPAVFRRRPAHVAPAARAQPTASVAANPPQAMPAAPPIDIVLESEPAPATPAVAAEPEPRIERDSAQVAAIAAGHAAVPALPVRSQATPIATAARLREAFITAAAAAAAQSARSSTLQEAAPTVQQPATVAAPGAGASKKSQAALPPIGAWSWEAQFVAAPVAPNPAPPIAEARITSEPAAPDHPVQPVPVAEPAQPRVESQLLAELHSMRDMLRQQLATMAAKPAPEPIAPNAPATRVMTRLLTAGFSAEVARRIAAHVPQHALAAQAESWLQEVLAHNIRCAGAGDGIVERSGRPATPGQTFALVGPTGVGKTTTVAKLAARFAVRHGTSALGLITLDAYRIAAPEQLRAYGRILGTPVHLVQDATSLRELLATMVHKRLVLIDTCGLSQRDERLPELLDLLAGAGTGSRPIQRVVLMNSASHAESLDEAARAWRANECTGAILTKLDEATRIGGALDVSLRHRLTLLGLTNGQRVPEDWHAANNNLLAHLALKPAANLFDLAEEEGAALLAAPAAQVATHGASHA